MYFYSHRVFWHFPEKDREETGWGKDLDKRARGSPFPSDPSWPNHTENKHKGGGERGHPVLWKRLHKATPTHTHKQAPSTPGAGRIREAEIWRGGGGKQHSLLTDRCPPSRPFLLYPQSLLSVPPLCLAILLEPLAASLLLGTKRKRVQSRETAVHPPDPLLHARWLSPLPSVVRGQRRLLVGHSLVEVDVAQILGWLLRGTHFLVIVDHPSGEVREGWTRMNKQGSPHCFN